MELLIYFLITMLGILLVLLVIGLCIPKERTGRKETIFEASPKTVFNIVTNNVDWQYRKDLKDLKILAIDGYKQSWEEYGKDGTVTRFKTLDYVPYSFYSFTMENKIMKGYYTSEYKETDNNRTIFTATEYITINNPFLRIMNRLFFNLDKYMDEQFTYLKEKIKETQTTQH